MAGVTCQGERQVDGREPRAVQPRPPSLSERPDRRGTGGNRVSDPAGQTGRRQAPCRYARRGRRLDVRPVDGLPVAGVIDSQSVKSAEKGGAGSTRTGTMRARRSKAKNGMRWSTRRAV